MKNVASVFGKPTRKLIPFNKVDWPLPEQLIGVEIEVETYPGVVHPTNLIPYWNKIRDGSLRNGNEYVLSQPLKGDALSRAIYELFHEAVLTRSTTGSTHVHIDMMEESTTPETIKVMVMLAYILEPAVFAIADPGREWCGYTNKLSSAPDALIGSVFATDDDESYRELRLLCGDNYRVGRYYGLNLLALQEHGSIEFRYFPTATSVDDVIEWVSLVQSFKKAALELGTISQLLDTVNSVDLYDSFLSNYFGQWKEVFLATVPHYTAANSVRKALAVAGSYKYRQSNTQVWNEEAVINNKLYSKFIKKVTKREGQLHIVAGNASLPTTDLTPGDVLVYRGAVYFSAAGRWHEVAEYIGGTGYRVEMRAAVSVVRANVSTIMERLLAAGETSTNTTRTVMKFNDIITYVANAAAPQETF